MGPTALDTLNSLPDSQIMQSGADYLRQKGVDKLLGALLENVLRNKPDRPVQWMIDVLVNSTDVEQAVQAASQGGPQQTSMSLDRKNALMNVFNLLDKQGAGSIQISAFRDYASQHGTATLASSDVEQIFNNIDTGNNNMVTADDFLTYMDKATHSMDNGQFQETVSALLEV
ncbi:hypothetical protein ABBQ38_010123 [Trebouxia sp. C0009 RCD-2024]